MSTEDISPPVAKVIADLQSAQALYREALEILNDPSVEADAASLNQIIEDAQRGLAALDEMQARTEELRGQKSK